MGVSQLVENGMAQLHTELWLEQVVLFNDGQTLTLAGSLPESQASVSVCYDSKIHLFLFFSTPSRGGSAPSYVYRLISELYHADDRDL